MRKPFISQTAGDARRDVLLVTAAIFLQVFLSALDTTIISTAMPTVIAALGGLKLWSFYLNLPLGLTAWLFVKRYLREETTTRRHKPPRHEGLIYKILSITLRCSYQDFISLAFFVSRCFRGKIRCYSFFVANYFLNSFNARFIAFY
ncbi:MAG: hypothetical protein ONB43_23695 [candidate division KSB1 bacterium]|nr:hypothetical protein [candidate division KSB1 bacterium]MDZ7407407.1 hypothetical protein [candidate division KSB1 bacterium]